MYKIRYDFHLRFFVFVSVRDKTLVLLQMFRFSWLFTTFGLWKFAMYIVDNDCMKLFPNVYFVKYYILNVFKKSFDDAVVL